jgi:hypothetical protein
LKIIAAPAGSMRATRASRNDSACSVAYLECPGPEGAWAWYGVWGEVVSAGSVEQAASGFVVVESTTFDIVLLQKAGAGGGQCRWSWCMSYTTLTRGGRTDGRYGRVRARRIAGDDVSI